MRQILKTPLTEALGITHPVISAPMALASGGALAAAVSRAGGLGLIGGGYGDRAWLEAQLALAGEARIGCGFITWALAKAPDLLSRALDHGCTEIFLSFGDPTAFAGEIHAAKARLICQVQTCADARVALDAGAAIIVAQGAEAGGHGKTRGTLALVPEIADVIAHAGRDALLVAAGGIAEGRGVAAALALGADGVLVGSRFWASAEALVHPNMHAAALAATGDDTIRSSVMDIARDLDWPTGHTARVLKNAFTEQWHGKEAALRADPDAGACWRAAWDAGDTRTANTFVGEAAGLIGDIRPAAEILSTMVAQAGLRLARAHGQVRAPETKRKAG